MPNVSNGTSKSYLSTTNLTYKIGNKIKYIDSSSIPAIVVPQNRSELVGSIVWVSYGGNATFAIVGDTGPAFGEGSVALHQYLRSGKIGPLQPVGPIAREARCTSVEENLGPPFLSRPSKGKFDLCRPGRLPSGASDIRAYDGIPSNVVTIILTSVKPHMSGHTALEPITPQLMKSLAMSAGYTPEKLKSMASCF